MNNTIVWLLDTNVVSEMMRPNPDPRVAAFLDANPREEMATSVVTVWEIEKGVGRVDPGRRREDLARRFRDIVEEFSGTGCSHEPATVGAHAPASRKSGGGVSDSLGGQRRQRVAVPRRRVLDRRKIRHRSPRRRRPTGLPLDIAGIYCRRR